MYLEHEYQAKVHTRGTYSSIITLSLRVAATRTREVDIRSAILFNPSKLTPRWKRQYCHSNKDCNTTACACLCMWYVCVVLCVGKKKTWKTQHRGPCQILKEETAASYSAKLRRECLERRCTFKRDKQESSSRSWQGTEAWKEGNKGMRRKDRW